MQNEIVFILNSQFLCKIEEVFSKKWRYSLYPHISLLKHVKEKKVFRGAFMNSMLQEKIYNALFDFSSDLQNAMVNLVNAEKRLRCHDQQFTIDDYLEKLYWRVF